MRARACFSVLQPPAPWHVPGVIIDTVVHGPCQRWFPRFLQVDGGKEVAATKPERALSCQNMSYLIRRSTGFWGPRWGNLRSQGRRWSSLWPFRWRVPAVAAGALVNNLRNLRFLPGNVSRFMQRLLSSHALCAHYKHHRPGHLFQGRFKARLVEDEVGPAAGKMKTSICCGGRYRWRGLTARLPIISRWMRGCFRPMAGGSGAPSRWRSNWRRNWPT